MFMKSMEESLRISILKVTYLKTLFVFNIYFIYNSIKVITKGRNTSILGSINYANYYFISRVKLSTQLLNIDRSSRF